MKKILIIFICTFLLIDINALECEPYLASFEVENYEVSPKYDKYNNIYTLKVDENVDDINLKYVKESYSSIVNINKSGHLNYGENIISISVKCDEEENIYTLYVNKKKIEPVSYSHTQEEIQTGISNTTIGVLVGSVVGVLIILFIYFLFRKKK